MLRDLEATATKTAKKTVASPISKKTLCTCSTLFCTFLCRCFARQQRETSRNFRVTRFMEEMLYVVLFTFFFAAAHFYLGARQHSSFSHRRYKIFTLFFTRNWSPLSLLSTPMQTLKLSRKRESALLLLLFFYLLKSEWLCDVPLKRAGT